MRLPMILGCLGLAACATGGERAPPPRAELTASLTGHQQTPHSGDLAGTGLATLRVDRGTGQVCWDLGVRGIATATAAQVRRGAAGSVGASVATLTTPDAGGRSAGCATVGAALAEEMIRTPHLFYVNVENADYPAGAIRGQLRGRVLDDRPTPVRQGI